MSNYYDQYTVAPEIPRRLLSPLHEAVLAACGFTCDHREGDPGVFIYCEFGIRDFDRADFYEFVDPGEEAAPPVLDVADGSPFAEQVRAALATDESVSDLWCEVFLDLVRAPTGDLSEITVIGGFHCDRIEPDGFGGAVHRFTAADGWQSGSTGSLLAELRVEAREINQLAEVLDLANAKAAELASAGTPIDAIAQAALAETHDRVVSHRLLNHERRPDPTPRAFARVEWEPGDLQDLRPNWTRAEATAWLAANAGEIKRRITDVGLTIIEAILARDGSNTSALEHSTPPTIAD